MSKSIGIKLADGSFYPILEEGVPEKKHLELTTVKDNQETVQVDLYRSETGSMEDAEYVDSLQIENLVAQPNGEPTLAFNIALDENNNLSAEICDPESGGKSDISIKLVNRDANERESVPNFDLSSDSLEIPEDKVSDDEILNIKSEDEMSSPSLAQSDLSEQLDLSDQSDLAASEGESFESENVFNDSLEAPAENEIPSEESEKTNEFLESLKCAEYDDKTISDIVDKHVEGINQKREEEEKNRRENRRSVARAKSGRRGASANVSPAEHTTEDDTHEEP